jgi:hypothetical protein
LDSIHLNQICVKSSMNIAKEMKKYIIKHPQFQTQDVLQTVENPCRKKQ